MSRVLKNPRAIVLSLIAALGCSVVAAAVNRPLDPTARAELKNAKGEIVGHATLTATPNGVLIRAAFTNVPPGAHAFHIHAVGQCSAPDFESAGAHFNPTNVRHGLMEPNGPHAGDLPNIHVGPSRKLDVELWAEHARLADATNAVIDADGAALVVHAATDDYKTDPAGNAGARIACGVVMR